MLPDKLKSLARDVAAQTARPTLTLYAQGLLFRDEVDSALSESWHPREYVAIYDHHHRAILNSIRFDLETRTVQPPLSEVIDDIGLAPAIDRPLQRRVHPLSVIELDGNSRSGVQLSNIYPLV
ncbi:MAG: hypothetical protein Q8M31_19125 [Beijerinckiaceae bacterium]|nr:hypothetical protein [Beijerinckiaceae bacterium]